MFQRFHEMKERRESGFTLIELLVVILIIAILAAIAIPVFLNQRKKGWTSQSQSALKNAATAMESYATGTGGDYSTATTADLATNGYSPTQNVTMEIVTPPTSANRYCLQATHALQPTDADTGVTGGWKLSSYDSAEGAPEQDDACTA